MVRFSNLSEIKNDLSQTRRFYTRLCSIVSELCEAADKESTCEQ